MPAKMWTDEQLAEIRRLRLCDFGIQEIADRLGVSYNAISGAMYRYKLITKDEWRYLKSRQMKGVSLSKRHCKAISAGRKKAWNENPVLVELKARQKAKFENGYAREIVKRSVRSRRGFDVPINLEDEYRDLKRKTGLSAQERGRILGIPGAEQVA